MLCACVVCVALLTPCMALSNPNHLPDRPSALSSAVNPQLIPTRSYCTHLVFYLTVCERDMRYVCIIFCGQLRPFSCCMRITHPSHSVTQTHENSTAKTRAARAPCETITCHVLLSGIFYRFVPRGLLDHESFSYFYTRTKSFISPR